MTMPENANPLKGEKFLLTITSQDQDRISSDKVRELLTAEQVREVTNTITMKVMKTDRHEGTKAKFVMPTLGNATLGGLVDMLGETREQIKDLQKYEGIYKDAINARLEALKKEAEAAIAAKKSNE